MPPLVTDLRYLLPWQFSPTIFTLTVVTVALYVRGLVTLRRNGGRIGFWRVFVFLLGLGLNYAALQTYVDYLSAHMFWIHRFQHLVLHHIGPVLMVLSGPDRILRAGIPAGLRAGADQPVGSSVRFSWRSASFSTRSSHRSSSSVSSFSG